MNSTEHPPPAPPSGTASASTSPGSVRYCDIVMKGGITSGVVYPCAITALARSYVFKNVGGTSAGAIAAAAAAAAELGRHRGTTTGGFSLLASLPDHLARVNASGHTNLFTFFQPQAATRPLFRVLTAALNRSTGGARARAAAIALVATYWFRAFIGTLPGAAIIWLAVHVQAGALSWIAGGLGGGVALAGLVGLPAWRFKSVLATQVPENFFGICSGLSGAGHPPPGSSPQTDDGEALTVWLTRYLNRLAGFAPDGAPLTFGQLWHPQVPAGGAEPPAPTEAEPVVNLAMMTTCLTWGRPFLLPFSDEDASRENRFYFKRGDFKRLFPAPVYDWLVAHPRPSHLPARWRDEGPEDERFVPLPEPWNLPVVVATRMSLSFPVLLSAIPLYAYDIDATPGHRDEHPPRRCLFSDGGICSNFPMHLFDSPLPRWPTFAINLVEQPDATPSTTLATPWMPPNNGTGIQEIWNPFDRATGLASLAGFVGTIINTMQNWSDNSLARLPGYRDRIAHVGLTSVEGGLNLDMPAPRITTLSKRGAAAGEEFVRRFSSGTESRMNWHNHRWLRMRSMLASLEEMLARVDRTCASDLPPDTPLEQWVRSTALGAAPSYDWQRKEQQTKALRTLRVMRAVHRMWQRSNTPNKPPVLAADGAPRPRPQLRPRARV